MCHNIEIRYHPTTVTIMPLATWEITLGIPPRLHTTKAKKTHKKKSKKAKKWRASDSSEDEDEISDHSVKKRGKSKWRCVETPEVDIESVEEDVEAVEVEVVVLDHDKQEVSIHHYNDSIERDSQFY